MADDLLERLVEAGARAIDPGAWERMEAHAPDLNYWRGRCHTSKLNVRAILNAWSELVRILPKEATEEMIDAYVAALDETEPLNAALRAGDLLEKDDAIEAGRVRRSE